MIRQAGIDLINELTDFGSGSVNCKRNGGPGRERKEDQGRALVQDTRMVRIDTKFLRLREPVLWGQEIDGWHVCWLGGWDKCRMFYIVMVVNRPASTKKKVKTF